MKLREFWEMVSDAGDGGWSNFWGGLMSGDAARGWTSQVAAGKA